MTTDTDYAFIPALPVINPNRYIHTPSLEINKRKHSDGTVITKWPIHHNFGGLRLYVRPKEVEGEYSAFDFELIGLIRRTVEDRPTYDSDNALIRSICHGHCAEEGVRYSYFGDPLLGAVGMVENLDAKALAEAMQYIAMYQKKWCVSEG